jgi:hypothetical protein
MNTADGNILQTIVCTYTTTFTVPTASVFMSSKQLYHIPFITYIYKWYLFWQIALEAPLQIFFRHNPSTLH